MGVTAAVRVPAAILPAARRQGRWMVAQTPITDAWLGESVEAHAVFADR